MKVQIEKKDLNEMGRKLKLRGSQERVERENETKRKLCWICKERKLKDEGSTSMSFK